jgi:hypothetical protein
MWTVWAEKNGRIVARRQSIAPKGVRPLWQGEAENAVEAIERAQAAGVPALGSPREGWTCRKPPGALVR